MPDRRRMSQTIEIREPSVGVWLPEIAQWGLWAKVGW